MIKKVKLIRKLGILAILNLSFITADAGMEKLVKTLGPKGSMINVTNTHMINEKEAGHILGGGASISAPSVEDLHLLRANAPSCKWGGDICDQSMDLYLGALSWVTKSQLSNFLKSLAQKAQTYGTLLAFKTVCPQCEDIMTWLQERVQEINSLNIEGCRLLRMGAGGAQMIADNASKQLRQISLFSNGEKSDMNTLQKKAAIDTDNSDDGLGEGSKNILADNWNLVWKALATKVSDNKSKNDKQLHEFLMTLTGTIIATKIDGRPNFTIKPSLVDKKNLAQFMGVEEDAKGMSIYKCNDQNKCLNPIVMEVARDDNITIKKKISLLLGSMMQKVAKDGKEDFTAEEMSLDQMSRISLINLLEHNLSEFGINKKGKFYLNEELLNAICYEVVTEYLSQLVDEVRRAVAEMERLQIADLNLTVFSKFEQQCIDTIRLLNNAKKESFAALRDVEGFNERLEHSAKRNKRKSNREIRKMIELAIHTYGYGELLLFVLNGIAKFRNSNAFMALISCVTIGTGLYCAVGMSAAYAGESWKVWMRKIGGVIIFLQVMLLPKTTMIVKDHVAWRVPKAVDNIPLAFALPVGIVENWGYILTKHFEQTFNWPNSKKLNNYSQYGTVFGLTAAQDLARSRIQNPEIATSMRSFIDRCIFTRGLIGFPFTLEEIRDSKNAWKLIKERYKPNDVGIITKWKKYEKGLVSTHNCTEGVEWMDNVLKKEITGLVPYLAKKWGFKDTSNDDVLKKISLAFNKKSAIDAEQVIEHHLILAGIHDTLALYDDSSYGSIRALMQYESSSWISWASSKILQLMLPIFKIITYVSFIMILPLFAMLGGFSRWRNWIIASFSLALWPPLYTILNMIIEYSRDSSQIITYGTLSTIKNQYDLIGAVAAALSGAIPFIATWVIRMGEGGFLQMSSAIMQAASGASSSIGAEIASGNVSLNNTNIGNETRNVVNRDKLNSNLEQFTGENSYNLPDGTHEKVTGTGNRLLMSGEGMNVGKFASNINMQSSIRDSLQHSLDNTKSYRDSKSTELHDGISSQKDNVREYASSILEKVDAGERINWSALGKNSEAVAQAVNHEILNNESYTSEVKGALSQRLEASFGAKIPLTKIGAQSTTALDISGSIGSLSSNDLRSISQDQYNRNFDKIIEASQNNDFNKSWGADKNLVDRISSQNSKNIGLQNSINKSNETIDSLQQRIEKVDSFGSDFNLNATHEVSDRLQKEYGMSAYQAQKLIDNPTRATTSERSKLSSAVGVVRDQYMDAVSTVPNADINSDFRQIAKQGDNGMKNLSKQGTNSVAKNYLNNNSEVNTDSAKDGIEINKIKNNLKTKEKELVAKNQNIIETADNNIKVIKDNNNKKFKNSKS